MDLIEAETTAVATIDHGWQKVTYPKRQRKTTNYKSDTNLTNGNLTNGDSKVFLSLEQQSEDRRRKILEAQKAADENVAAPGRSKRRSDDEDDDDYGDSDGEVKKPKITVVEAAVKIDESDLATFLIDVSESYEEKQDIQMMRFADYFGRAFSGVGAAQFP